MRFVHEQYECLADGYFLAKRLDARLQTHPVVIAWQKQQAVRRRKRLRLASIVTIACWASLPWLAAAAVLGSRVPSQMGSTLDALGSLVTLLACVIAMGLTMLTAALALNIGRRKQEQQPVYRRWINTVSDNRLPAQTVLYDQFLRNGNKGIEDYTRYGAQGVSLTLHALVHSLGDGWFALTNVMISKSEDADIVVVGPSGVWILESKYWSGYINIEQSKWSRVRVYYAPGGDRQTEYTQIRKAWDDQWLRQGDAIARSLRGTLSLPNRQSLREMIDGGIVLSHRKARRVRMARKRRLSAILVPGTTGCARASQSRASALRIVCASSTSCCPRHGSTRKAISSAGKLRHLPGRYSKDY